MTKYESDTLKLNSNELNNKELYINPVSTTLIVI